MTGMLADKVAVVTGGGTGIGAEVARAFAAEGCRVVVAGRRPAPLEAVAREVGGLAHPADVSREDQVKDLFAACERAYGRLDVVVNNAGWGGPEAAADEMDMAAWDQTMAANTRSVILCIKHAVPLLRRQGGAIVNVSSRSGVRAKPRRSAYSASKFAVVGLTQAVAFELGPLGIRCNVVCPGGTDTEMWRDIVAERARQKGVTAEDVVEREFRGPSALRRIVRPQEVASVILFLASDAASAITAETVVVDAGRI